MEGFTEEELKKKGFVSNGKGGWKKCNDKNINPQPEKIIEKPHHIWMPMNVPSSKNSKAIKWLFKSMKGKVSAYMQMGKGGRRAVTPIISENKRCVDYREQTKAYWIDRKKYFHRMIEGLEKPYIIEFTFVRKTRTRFDFHNAVQLPCDLMVEHGWIEDDDMRNILPVPPLPPRKPFIVDKKSRIIYSCSTSNC